MFAYSNIFISSSAPTTSATCQREREKIEGRKIKKLAG